MWKRAAIGAAFALLGLVSAGSGPAGDARNASGADFRIEQARAFDEFPLFNAGDRVDGLPLTAVLRRDDTASYVSFVYGDCVAADDTGCAPPAEIQVWPACRRSIALYDVQPSGSPPPERVVVRGVPAASLDDGRQLEIQTGRSTIVVFADSRARAARIAGALRLVNVPEPPTASLPPPSPGALEGMLTC